MPLLTLAFHVDIRYAIGASLVSVIATSSGAAAAYVREGYSNIRVGMFLEIATTIGAITGALLAVHLPLRYIAIIFGLVLLYSAYVSYRPPQEHPSPQAPGRLASFLRMDATYPTPEGLQQYHVAGNPGRIRPDVRRGRIVGHARHRLGRRQSSRHGPRSCACLSKSPPPPAIS